MIIAPRIIPGHDYRPIIRRIFAQNVKQHNDNEIDGEYIQ
jgi:hypothetical protein